MDLFNTFVMCLLIQLLLYARTNDISSSFVGSAGCLQYSSPFLSLYTIGYIQCQKTCVRYSDCDVLQYTKLLLECHLYIADYCNTTTSSSKVDIHLRRDDIHERIFGNCQRGVCPTSTCVQQRGGGNICVIDRVVSHYHSFGASFVDIEGTLFGVYPKRENFTEAQQRCVSYSGRLAVLDSLNKIETLTAAIQRHHYLRYFIGGYRTADGTFNWTTGGLVNPIHISSPDEMCVALGREGILHDHDCSSTRTFICEL